MADAGRLQGERVFCHECSNQWNRAQGGLQCPSCNSDFTEVLEEPVPLPPEARVPPPIPHQTPNHQWQDNVEDPEEDDIRTYQWNSRGGNGSMMFTSRTVVSGGRLNGRNVNRDPVQNLTNNFESLLTHMLGTQNARNDPFMPQIGHGFFPFGGQPQPDFGLPAGFGPSRNFPRFPHDHDDVLRPEERQAQLPQPMNLQDMFSMIFGALNQPATRPRGPNQPPDLATLIAGLMGPPNGRAGDAVFTQEAFDQVMTQLMEQNPGSTAPPPATEDAIDALPTKKVTADMMGSDGKVECSICMDDLELGAEVTVLPCEHWFHHDCIKHWLKSCDTCPHCRKSIQNHDPQAGNASSRRNRGSTGPRPSSVASPRPRTEDVSQRMPSASLDSPSAIRERRQQYFGSMGQNDGDTSRAERRSSSTQSATRPNGERQASSSNNTGGAMGWMRNHLPFGG